MKKRIFSFLLTFAFIVAFLSVATSTTKTFAATDNYVAEIEHVVTFDLNGGKYNSSNANFTQIVKHGGLIIEPNKDLLTRRNSSFYDWETETGTTWNFKEDTVNQDITLFAYWDWDDTQGIDDVLWNGNIAKYLDEKYYLSTGWTMANDNSTEKVSGYKPIEMKGEDTDLFPTSDIEAAIEAAGVVSSYGGCGPIAMMGILDYFARYKSYTSIMKNPTVSYYRRILAEDVLRETKTYEVGSLSAKEMFAEQNAQSKELQTSIEAKSSSGEKQTMTLPGDYVNAFNNLVNEKYNLGQQIQAHDQGFFLVGLDQKINRIKESIDSGLPVTVYSGAYGYGNFSEHYVNVFGYEDWHGYDRFGNAITNVVFLARYNWGWGQNYIAYMDSTMLIGGFTGVIYYTLKGSNNQLIRASDFASEFVNANGQGQYFFYEKSANITTADGFTFGTSRLRCSYIEVEIVSDVKGKYLVLSANRLNAGRAYLKMNFTVGIKSMNFDIGRWSTYEGLIESAGDYVKLFYLDSNGSWIEAMNFTIDDLPTNKDILSNMYIEFAQPTNGIKFEVYKASPSGDRNKGRIVLDNMNLFY